MKRMRIILVICFAIIASTNTYAKKINLIHKLDAGSEYGFQVSLIQEMTQEMMGESQMSVNTNITNYHLKVLEETGDGNFLIEAKVTGMKMKIENDYINLEYDSESGEQNNAGLALLANTIGIPVTFLLSPQGDVIEIVDGEEYLKATDALISDMPGEMQQMLAALYSQLASPDNLQRQLSGLFFKFPEKKIKIGGSWEKNTSEGFQMIKFKNDIDNQLVEADNEKAVIKQSVIIRQMEMEGMEVEGMKVNYELGGRKAGGVEIDLSTGLMNSVNAVTDISGIISIESPQLAGPMSIPMIIKATESLKRIK